MGELGPFGIVGLGLVGGSLARAITKLGLGEVLGVDADPATCRAAMADGVVTRAETAPYADLMRARLVVLCVPLGPLDAVCAALAPHLGSQAVLSDVIGVKAPVAARLEQLLPRVRYVGSHPMAGGEHGGYGATRADLFEHKGVAVCPGPTASAEDVALVTELWRRVGAVPTTMTPDEHDRVVATTSHLPYVSALALVHVASQHPGVHLAGRGFFDATRRADFSPEVMAAVVMENPHIGEALRAQAAELVRLAQAAERGELIEEARRARETRRRLDGGK